MTNEVLDTKWFNALREILFDDVDWIQSFCKVDERERHRFLIGEVENPKFSLCSVVASQLPEYGDRLRELREKVEAEERNEHVRALYLSKLDRRLGFIPMYQASELRDDAAFHAAAVSQYGKPKRELFTYAAKRIKDLIVASERTSYTESRKSLNRVFAKIDTTKVTLTPDILPSPVTDTSATVTSGEVVALFEATLTEYHMDGWRIECDRESTRTRFAVNSQKQLIYVPNDKAFSRRAKPLTLLGARAIAEHEIGVHALRAHNGAQTNLLILSNGLAGYLRGEEGLAAYVQQQVEGAREFYGFDRYLAISLAVGMDGTKRDFRSVFEILRHYYLLLQAAAPGGEERAVNAAWETSVRIFRGTTGTSVGTPFMRDIVYFEGNVGMWNLLIDRPEVFDSLFVGKFDPQNREHTKALSALGILNW